MSGVSLCLFVLMLVGPLLVFSFLFVWVTDNKGTGVTGSPPPLTSHVLSCVALETQLISDRPPGHTVVVFLLPWRKEHRLLFTPGGGNILCVCVLTLGGWVLLFLNACGTKHTLKRFSHHTKWLNAPAVSAKLNKNVVDVETQNCGEKRPVFPWRPPCQLFYWVWLVFLLYAVHCLGNSNCWYNEKFTLSSVLTVTLSFFFFF